jgi:hypothetical protein
MATIKRKELTNDKWMVWATNDGVNCQIFHFSEEPSQEQVDAEMKKITDREEAEAAEKAYLDALLDEEQKLLEELNGSD